MKWIFILIFLLFFVDKITYFIFLRLYRYITLKYFATILNTESFTGNYED